MKIIEDIVWGSIEVSDLSLQFIDTKAFQRLHNLKQLGTCSWVWCSANHTRFEHSLGVMHLAKRLLHHLQDKHPELGIDDRRIELVGIAGLLHDLGHGPFSHVFDDSIISELKINNGWEHHELRSIDIMRYIIEKNSIEISEEEQDWIASLINPEREYNDFWHNIISSKGPFDVDKADYLIRDSIYVNKKPIPNVDKIIKWARVIDNRLCFSEHIQIELNDFISTRYKMHKQIYQHHAVLSIQAMISDMMLINKEYYRKTIEEKNIESFINLDDRILYIFELSNEKTTTNIMSRLYKRDLYKIVDRIESDKKLEIKEKENQKIIESKLKWVPNEYKYNNLQLYNKKTNQIVETKQLPTYIYTILDIS